VLAGAARLAALAVWTSAAAQIDDFAIVGNTDLGQRIAQGGLLKPRGFKESTPIITGMPRPSFDPAIEYANGLTDLEFGCFMQAREDFRHTLTVQPKNAKAWFLLGVTYNSTGDRAAAAAAYSKALNADPKMIDAQRELAVSLALQGQVDKAQTILASLKTSAANCAGGCGDADLLKQSVTRVEAAVSGQLNALMQPIVGNTGCSALSTGAAKNCFTAAKFFRASSWHDDIGQREDGINDCTTALGSSLPDEVKARVLINRGVIRISRKQATQALADFNGAIALNGQVGDAYTNRGTAQLMLKQFEQARADIDKGLALGSAEPQRAYYNRGSADEHLGDTKAAYADYLQAAKLDPNWEAPKLELKRFSVMEQ
jgi:tetratricopeptide (TPR) repeat protein